MKYRFVLWFLGQLLKRAHRRSPEFRDNLEKKGPFSFGIGLDDDPDVGRHYTLAPKGVDSGEGVPVTTDLELRFQDTTTAVSFLKRPSARHFRTLLMAHRLRLVGSVRDLERLQALLKHVRK
ncbi:hypothetical protein [Larsenimonas suaedae]|uniref:SCP2 domain-containing protein n=1 Tax=Larsenimonas suaedae TaxID=1851019 RepID=A0ABU1GVW3_9GAMM|nr:hypothetical protein [Larsenimonas suaedae]MCM2973255.1 hypothetical protein [Larsenimonas suaedae]MDR5896148.1 hypothetical protein [Larsenimonas suaedae]